MAVATKNKLVTLEEVKALKDNLDSAIAQSTAKTQAIVINDSQTTWSDIYAKLKDGLNNVVGGRSVALITVYSTAATNILSGGNISSFFKGYVTLSGANSNLYDFFGGPLSSGDMYAWRVTASDSAPTISNFRSYADYEKSTAWSNNWLTNTSILAYAASVANPSFTTFRTNATSTDVPIASEYYIGTVERYGQNITVKMTTMQDASKMYINNSTNGGSTWTGWKTFLDSEQLAKSVKLVSDSVYTDFDDLWQNGNGIFSIRTSSTNQSAPVPQSDGYWYVFQATIYSDNRFGVQIATRSTNNYNVYMRKRASGTNYPWIKITFENIT